MDAATLFDVATPAPVAPSATSPADAAQPEARPTFAETPGLFAAARPALVAPPSITPGDTPGLDRARVLEGILRVNRTVAREFLDQFKDDSLRRYLAHLESAERPRDRHAHWSRPEDSPSIIGRESAL